jgi:hypothetical protein
MIYWECLQWFPGAVASHPQLLYCLAAANVPLLQQYGHPTDMNKLYHCTASFGGDLGVVLTRSWLADVVASIRSVFVEAKEWVELYTDWLWHEELSVLIQDKAVTYVRALHRL